MIHDPYILTLFRLFEGREYLLCLLVYWCVCLYVNVVLRRHYSSKNHDTPPVSDFRTLT